MGAPLGDVLIDGWPTPPSAAGISVFDIGFQRGYGAFEAMRSYGGVVFRLGAHLDRLALSAQRLGCGLPARRTLEGWCREVATRAGDAVVRVFRSGGTDPRHPGVGSRTIVYAEAVDPSASGLTVQTRVAPWHPDGATSELTGAKVLSYAFNLAATLAARSNGFDDALLVGRSGAVLEGPTFSVAWIERGTLFTPSLELGILASITRAAVLEVAAAEGIEVQEGAFPLAAARGAAEVLALSTVREVLPVVRIDERVIPGGPVASRLAAGFRRLVARECGR